MARAAIDIRRQPAHLAVLAIEQHQMALVVERSLDAGRLSRLSMVRPAGKDLRQTSALGRPDALDNFGRIGIDH